MKEFSYNINPEAKSTKDIPESIRDEFVDLPDGGFVTKKAYERLQMESGNVDQLHDEALKINKLFDDLNKNYNEPERNSFGYSETLDTFIKSLSDEQFETLRKKCFYHVTNKDNIRQIMEKGLDPDDILSIDKDFQFLKSMYERYGRGFRQWIFDSLVMGGEYSNSDRNNSARLSSDVQVHGYSIPERVKFMLQNLKFLENTEYLQPEEKKRCQEILKKYSDKFNEKENYVYVLSLSVLSPSAIRNFLPLIEDCIKNKTKPIDIIRYITSFEHGDIDWGAIPSQELKVEGIFDLDEKNLKEALDGTTGICFEKTA